MRFSSGGWTAVVVLFVGSAAGGEVETKVIVQARIGMGDATNPRSWHDLQVTAESEVRARAACEAVVKQELRMLLPEEIRPMVMRECDTTPLPPRQRGPALLVMRQPSRPGAIGKAAAPYTLQRTDFSSSESLEECETRRRLLAEKNARSAEDDWAREGRWLEAQIAIQRRSVESCRPHSVPSCELRRGVLALMEKKRNLRRPEATGISECRIIPESRRR
jgi:hypothetical protein